VLCITKCFGQATQQGLEVGDEVVSVNGIPCARATSVEFKNHVVKAGRPFVLTVARVEMNNDNDESQTDIAPPASDYPPSEAASSNGNDAEIIDATFESGSMGFAVATSKSKGVLCITKCFGQATQQGLEVGDEVLAVNGENCTTASSIEFKDLILNAGRPFVLRVARSRGQGQPATKTKNDEPPEVFTPEAEPPAGTSSSLAMNQKTREIKATFEDGPLGIAVSKTKGKLLVTKSSGQAEAKNVKAGDEVVALNETSCVGASSATFKNAVVAAGRPFVLTLKRTEGEEGGGGAALESLAADLANPGAPKPEPGGEPAIAHVFDATFGEGPLGLGVSKTKGRLTITKAFAQAEEQSVAVGDEVVMVNGASCVGASSHAFKNLIVTAGRPFTLSLKHVGGSENGETAPPPTTEEPKQLEREIKATFKDGPLGLSVQTDKTKGGLFVTNAVGEAENEGLQVGDEVVAVNDESCRGSKSEVFKRLIVSAGRPFELTLVRLEESTKPGTPISHL